MRWFYNVFYLCIKEFRSLLTDPVLLGLIVYIFTAGVWVSVSATTTELKNASIAIVDDDQSQLSSQLKESLLAPQFKPPVLITSDEVDRAMDMGKYAFVVNIPTNYQLDLMAGYQPKIQLLIDATTMTQAALGANYVQQIFATEIQSFLKYQHLPSLVNSAVQVLYNPNHSSHWFQGLSQIGGNLTLITLLLVGAAVIREKERGTMEHLLVMPVTSSEIAVAKIIANGLIILCVSMLSLYLVVHIGLKVPMTHSAMMYFALGVAVFLFSIASLGILLATATSSMPQFGLLCIPIYIVMHMLSGAASPIENMPETMQYLTQLSPQTVLNKYMQEVIFKNASLALVWPHLLKMLITGIVFLSIALIQFKSMLSRQG